MAIETTKLQDLEFDEIINNRLDEIKNTLSIKAKEYIRNNDVLHNFNVAARINNITREKALLGFMTKHYVSLLDIINDIDNNKLPSEIMLNEKIGDILIYLCLLEVSIKDKIRNH